MATNFRQGPYQQRITAALLGSHWRCGFSFREDYQSRLEAYGITCSMSRRGDCYDNAVMESWFSTVTSEEGERFESYAHAKEALFHNQRRRHSTLGQISPAEFERRASGPGVDAAGTADAETAPAAPWKPRRRGFPQRPHRFF